MSSGNNTIPNVAYGHEDRVIKETVKKNPVKTLEHYEPKTGTKRKNSDAIGEEKKMPKH
jgi:hypothetical protein